MDVYGAIDWLSKGERDASDNRTRARVIAEGKTKIIYAHPTKTDLVYMAHKDGLSAGDGARRNVLPGKGKLACRTTSNVFYLLEQKGVAYPLYWHDRR